MDEEQQILLENENFTISPSISGPAIAVFVSIEMVAALLINSSLLAIIFLHPKPRSMIKAPSNIYLTSMLLVNLLASLTVMLFMVIATASGEWILGNSLQSKVGSCKFAGFMFWYVSLLLVIILTIISVDRWLFIVKSRIYKRIMTAPVAITVVIVSWLLAAALNTTPLYGFGAFAYSSSPGSCFPVWKDQRAYLGFFVVIYFVLLSIVMGTSIWTFCFSRKFIRRMSMHNIDASSGAAGVYTFRWRKLIGIFGTLSIVYAVCFTPALLYLMLRLITPIPSEILPAVFIFFFLFTVLSPLVQSFFRKDIKDVLIDFLAKTPLYTKEEDDDHYTGSRSRSHIELRASSSTTAVNTDNAAGSNGDIRRHNGDNGYKSHTENNGNSHNNVVSTAKSNKDHVTFRDANSNNDGGEAGTGNGDIGRDEDNGRDKDNGTSPCSN